MNEKSNTLYNESGHLSINIKIKNTKFICSKLDIGTIQLFKENENIQ